jgi:hypothetical protein
MPQEIIDKMGIKYKTLPDERLRENDQKLIVLLYSLLNVENKELVREFLGEEYISYMDRKVERLKAIKDNVVVNLSEKKK